MRAPDRNPDAQSKWEDNGSFVVRGGRRAGVALQTDDLGNREIQHRMTNSPQDNLQSLANVATVANYFKLSDIERQAEEVNAAIAQQQTQAQYQAKIRQDIFVIRQDLEKKVPQVEKVVAWILLDKMERYLSSQDISASSYDAIVDKEYFTQTHSMIEKAVDDLKSVEEEASQIRTECEAFYELHKLKEQVHIDRSSLRSLMYRRYTFGFVLIAIAVAIAIAWDTVYISFFFGPIAYLLSKEGWEAHKRYKRIPRSVMEVLKGCPIQSTERYSFEESIRHLDAAISASRERTLGHLARHPELKVIYP